MALERQNVNLSIIWQIIQFVLSVFSEVHAAQAAMPGAPGADKSQAVIDKVTPIANVVGAEIPHIQSLIDTAVTLFKHVGVFTPSGGVAPTAGTDPAANGGG